MVLEAPLPNHDAHAMELAGNQLSKNTSEAFWQLLRVNWLIQCTYGFN
jgi:uncharacterized membrane protein